MVGKTENSPFLPLIEKLDKMLSEGSVILAIEGGSASGKSTLSEMLREKYVCAVIHADDFFLQLFQRTPERFAEVGGNIDRERLFEEVINPLCKNEPMRFRKFDCSSLTLSEVITLNPERLTVIEGAYSMHPYFGKYWDLSVFLDISPDLQRERILRRNTPEQAEMFFDRWIPFENRYFTQTDITARCDIIIPITG